MPEYIVIGAGAAGLVAANALHELGKEVLVLERADGPGGRLRTDVVDGYRFDRGFQILLTAYPAVLKWLDLGALNVRAFEPGAHILLPDGSTTRVGDPLRRPKQLLKTLGSPIGTLLDKARLLALVAHVRRRTCAELFAEPESTTEEYLQRRGFNRAMIEHFFRPFYGGIFLERYLATSSRFFTFTFKMFAEGDAVLPRLGIQAIGQQLADRLPSSSVRFNETVAAVLPEGVELSSGERVDAAHVLDTRPPAGSAAGDAVEWLKTINVYFSAKHTALPLRTITLLPGGRSVNNVAVVSGVQPSYAPSRQHLISVSVYAPSGGDLASYARLVRQDLAPWLADELDDWTALRHYEVDPALPFSPHTEWTALPHRWRTPRGNLHFGDWRLHPSLQAAMHSGQLAAESSLRPGY